MAMRKMLQYYDRAKAGQISVVDLAIELSRNLPIHKSRFGAENVAVYVDPQTKQELIELGIDCPCIKDGFVPLENDCHTLRWLSIMAMQTEPFQICPLDQISDRRDTDCLEVRNLYLVPFIPALEKYGIEQTGGMAGGDIINVPDAYITMSAFAEARNIIQDNEITDESEIQQLMGAMLYKVANEMQITITKYQ